MKSLAALTALLAAACAGSAPPAGDKLVLQLDGDGFAVTSEEMLWIS